MSNVNLEEFWMVQLGSGTAGIIYTSQSKALVTAKLHDQQLNKALEAWLAGDTNLNASLVTSILEPDLEGGCEVKYIVNPAWYSSITHYPNGSTNKERWVDNKGFSTVQWGNPALQRGVNNAN